MRSLPPEPRPGDKISANLICEIIRAIRERTIIGGPGLKTSFGPNGTVLSARAKSAVSSYEDKSCFRLGLVRADSSDPEEDEEENEEENEEEEEEEEAETHVAVCCCYYNVGGITKHMDDTDIQGLIPEDPEEGQPAVVKIICFKLSGEGASIVALSPESLLEEQKRATNYVYPLYRYVGSEMKDDLRNAPNVQFWEDGLT